MNTTQFLVLGLILIVIMLLFKEKREPFHNEKRELNIENIVNELETVLCLMDTCPHCQRFKNMTNEQIKSDLGIPGHIKLTKVVHMGLNDKESQKIFENFNIDSAPSIVVNHPMTKQYVKTFPSKEMIFEKVKEIVPLIISILQSMMINNQ